ncbi:hypothetical protein KL919_002842 [Ogataea angusta]|uniref:AB hydrolase-1 domain-containing protein n=1 Tax=Pichia angusta TaxID=870730 RepID=A0AAN6DGQ9_PICAN|nr:uncharacterized protein KL928_003007 [Ogataea angusta]KAG7819139.1 hypothetical protein KL928_003007 [Ogataea angusta]KAG7825387.1 hypothetical protein KL909_001679 [Ogataea angusta]KAG7834295.1 hypothetical protein KL943_002679 [Ogataea angusta]KAG7847806.1 hypothetical protein KL941_001985 [Ogataea angusta]KAG7860137.1 hypothetical protein KL919_002842 [Ogataea angusta]
MSATKTAHPVTLQEKEKPHVSYWDSLKLYWSFKPLSHYEDQILSFLPFYPNPTDKKRAEVINTLIDDKNNYIHEFLVENIEKTDGVEQLDIVLVHGYGAALGFFYANFDGLTKLPGTRLHAIDLPGFGLSSRPPFPNLKGDTADDVTKSEDFFIDAMEKWRIAKGLDRFILIGHSLGGYLSCCYYMKYGAGVVNKIVLVSPVGIERSDLSFYVTKEHALSIDKETELARREGIDLTNEFTDHQADHTQVEEVDDTNDVVSITSDSGETDTSSLMTQVRRAPQVGKLFTRLWERNYSPFQILRLFGPFAGRLVSGWTFNRFSHLQDPKTLLKINEYTAKTMLARGSGEFALTRLLAPGAVAKLPISERLPDKIKIKSLWLYGDVDWMSKEGGYEIVKEINEKNKDNENARAKFRIVKNAGHHVYLDNAPDFEYQVLKFINC